MILSAVAPQPPTSCSPPWWQTLLQFFCSPPHSKVLPLLPYVIWNIMCHSSSPIFLEQKSLFLDLLIWFIKSFKTLELKRLSRYNVMILWYYTWKNPQVYYNKVIYMYHRKHNITYTWKATKKSKTRKMKRNSQ